MFVQEGKQKDNNTEELGRRTKLRGLNDLLGFAVMPREGIMMMKDGALSTTFIFCGPDVDSSTDSELDALCASFNNAVRLLDDGWMIDLNLTRLPSTDYPELCDFPDTVSALIDDERRTQYQKEGNHYDTHNFLTITWAPSKEVKSAIKKFAIETDEEIKQETLDDLIEKFEAQLSNIIDTLSQYITIERLEGETLLSYLHYCITGTTQPVSVPKIPIYMDTYLASEDFSGGVLPKIGNKYIKVLDFKDFPMETWPTILDRLNSFPMTYRWTTRFIPLSTSSAEKHFKDYRRNWNQKVKGFMGLVREAIGIEGEASINRDALEMLDDTEEAKANNSSGLVRFGFLTKTVVLMHEDLNQLEEYARFVRGELQQLGFLIRIETVNAVEGYLGSIPGHGYYNIRRPLFNSMTLAHVSPLSSVYQGEKYAPCPLYPENSAPLFYSATTGATPFRFNLHVDDVGHSMIIGPTGAGKTTLLGLIMAQHRKYPESEIFLFDKDNSNKPIVLALEGDYYDLGQNESITFAPLSKIDEPEEFDWGCGFVEELAELQGVEVYGDKKEKIRDAMNSLKSTKKEFRTLHHLATQLQDEELRTAIGVYAHDSIAGKLLNAHMDSIEDSSFMGFELGWLLEQKEEIYIPVINYLFRKLYGLFKQGKPALLILEEAWLYLDNKIFVRKLKDWLKTLRKFNASVIFTSQALSDIKGSEISPVLLESCKTKIYLPNEKAKDASRSIYEYCGLNERQIEIIAYGRQKRDYYVTNTYGNRLIDLGLGVVTLAFVGISSKEDRAKFYEIYDQNNREWVSRWLQYKKLNDWEQYWQENYGSKNHVS